MQNGRIAGCYNSETAEIIDTKFDAGDNVHDITSHANIKSDRPIGSVPADR